MLEESLQTILETVGDTYALELPDGCEYPAVVWTLITEDDQPALDNHASYGQVETVYQVTIWGKDLAVLKTKQRALQSAYNGFGFGTFGSTAVTNVEVDLLPDIIDDNEGENAVARYYGVVLQFRIFQ